MLFFLYSFAFKSRMPNAACRGHDGLRVLAAPLSAPSIGHSSCLVHRGNQATTKGSGRRNLRKKKESDVGGKRGKWRLEGRGGGNGFIKTIPVARGAWSKPRVRNNERVSPVHVPVHVYIHRYTLYSYSVAKGAYTPNTIPKAWINFCHNRNFIKSYRNSFVSRERLINRIGYKGVSFCFRVVVVARPNDPLIKNYAKHESRTRVSLTNTVIVASPFLQIDLI